MDEGTCVYFGPWNPHAAQLLSRYLPASHMLAAAGQAEQPVEDKKKPVKKEAKKEEKVRRRLPCVKVRQACAGSPPSPHCSPAPCPLSLPHPHPPHTEERRPQGQAALRLPAPEEGHLGVLLRRRLAYFLLLPLLLPVRPGVPPGKGRTAYSRAVWLSLQAHCRLLPLTLQCTGPPCCLSPHPTPPTPPLQLADYFIRWWTRDHYNQYGDCTMEPCSPTFYVMVSPARRSSMGVCAASCTWRGQRTSRASCVGVALN